MKQTTGKRIPAALLICAILITTILAQTVTASASTNNISTSYVGKKTILSYIPWYDGSSKTKTVYADLTRDNKADKIKIKTSAWSSSSDYVKKVSVILNGKTALTINFSEWQALYVKVKYIRQSKSKEYLCVEAAYENDITTFCKIYLYNSSTGKFKCVLNALNTYDELVTASLGTVTKSKLNITYTVQPPLTGYIKWNYSYKYTNGKLKLTSAVTTNVHSQIADFGGGTSAYRTYFLNDQFVTQKTLKLYKSPGSNTVSATIAADKVVSMDKIRVKNKKIYLYFTCGSQSGWVEATDDWSSSGQMDTFYGILYAG